MVESYSFEFEGRQTMVINTCDTVVGQPVRTLPQASQPWIQPVDMSVNTMPTPFDQMRRANNNFHTWQENQSIFKKLSSSQNLDAIFKDIMQKQPMLLEPSFPECTSWLQKTSIYGLAAHLSNLTGLQVSGCALAALVCVAAATQGRVTVHGKWKEPLNLRSFQSAVSGSHKTVCYDRLIAPFYNFEKQASESDVLLTRDQAELCDAALKKKKKEFIKDIDLSDEGCLDKICQFIDDLGQNPIVKAIQKNKYSIRTVISEATIFAIQYQMNQNGGAIFYASDESTGLEKLFCRDKLSTLNRSYDQEPERYIYNKQENTIQHPSLSMLSFSQPSVMARIYAGPKAPMLHESGTLARVLPFVHHPHGAQYNLNGDEVEIYESVITDLLNFFYPHNPKAKRFLINMDPEAMSQFNIFKDSLSTHPQVPDAQKYWLAKLAGQSMRLAAAFHFYRYGAGGIDRSISVEDYMAARDIAATLVGHNLWLVNPTGLAAKENALKIARYLKRIPNTISQRNIAETGLPSSQIIRMTGLRRQEVNEALYLLFYTNWAALYDDGSGNLEVRFRPEFFTNNLQEIAPLPKNSPMRLF